MMPEILEEFDEAKRESQEPFEDWRKELDNLRPKRITFPHLTEGQKEQLKHARSGERPVPYKELTEWFNKKYDMDLPERTIMTWCANLK